MKKYMSIFLVYLKLFFPMTLLLSIGNILLNCLMMIIVPAIQGYGDYFLWPLYTYLIFAGMLLIQHSLLSSFKIENYDYTLARLKVSEITIINCRLVANMLCISLLWLSAIIAICLNCQINFANLSEASEIWHFIYIYSNRFLIGVFPVELHWIWLRNIIYLIVLSLSAAMGPTELKMGSYSTIVPCQLLILYGLPYSVNSGFPIVMLTLSIIMLGLHISRMIEIHKQKKVYFNEGQI